MLCDESIKPNGQEIGYWAHQGFAPLATQGKCTQTAWTIVPQDRQTLNVTRPQPPKKQKGLGSLVNIENIIREESLPGWDGGHRRRNWKLEKK